LGQSAGELVQSHGPGVAENVVTYGIPGLVGLAGLGFLYNALKSPKKEEKNK